MTVANTTANKARNIAKNGKRKVYGKFLTKHTARAKRRANGDFKPVNTEASLVQHPQGRYANMQKAKRDAEYAAIKAAHADTTMVKKINTEDVINAPIKKTRKPKAKAAKVAV